MAPEQNLPIRCHTCGLIDTHNFCSRCGTALQQPDASQHSMLRTLGRYLSDVFVDLLLPILAFIKTFWVIVINPGTFFSALFDGQGTTSQIDFPLSAIWQRLAKAHTYQHTLEPVTYYIAALVLAFFFIANPTLEILRGGLLWQSDILRDVTDALINQGVILMMLLYSLLFIAGFAFIFGLAVPRDRLPARDIYNFWLFSFSTLLGSLAITYFITFSIAESFPEDSGWGVLIVVLVVIAQSLLALRIIYVTPFSVFTAKAGRPRLIIGLVLGTIYWVLALLIPFQNLTTAAIFLSPIYLIINSTPLLLLAILLFLLIKISQAVLGKRKKSS